MAIGWPVRVHYAISEFGFYYTKLRVWPPLSRAGALFFYTLYTYIYMCVCIRFFLFSIHIININIYRYNGYPRLVYINPYVTLIRMSGNSYGLTLDRFKSRCVFR